MPGTKVDMCHLDFFQSQLSNRKFCPVGKLLPGVSVVIMDTEDPDNLKMQPVGVPGEVYVRFMYIILRIDGKQQHTSL